MLQQIGQSRLPDLGNKSRYVQERPVLSLWSTNGCFQPAYFRFFNKFGALHSAENLRFSLLEKSDWDSQNLDSTALHIGQETLKECKAQNIVVENL